MIHTVTQLHTYYNAIELTLAIGRNNPYENDNSQANYFHLKREKNLDISAVGHCYVW